jgi:hypothetical protein
MKIGREINNREDAEEFLDLLTAIVNTYRLREAAFEAPQIRPEAPSATPKKAKNTARAAEPAAPEQPELPLHIPKEEDPREQLRIRCRERGAVWLRPQLSHYGVKQLVDLTNDQVADLLHTLDIHDLAQ